jgi:dTDP-4-amino-4,6-dideoxygalactose transaminase
MINMSTVHHTHLEVPYFRPSISEGAIREVVACLRSGWLTTGPRTKEFEQEFAAAVGAKHAIALNSCTAALHLAVESLNLQPGQCVLVPTMTVAATAEVVRYQGAVPLLVDCDPVTLNMDLADAEKKLAELKSGQSNLDSKLDVVGMIPVHVGGLMMDSAAIHEFATRHGLWVVEDAAHAFPAAVRRDADSVWRWCGENTAAVTCFSFYANKCITTGEGGMAVTDDAELASRIRCMSLHGLSNDAWTRRQADLRGNWDYQIVAPGYKYNLTDIAAAIGLEQLRRSEELRQHRQAIAHYYLETLGDLEQLELPPDSPDRIHTWHLFPIRLRLDRLTIDRNTFLKLLSERGVKCSVHWRPLHLHPYYQETYGWQPQQLAHASRVWERLISLPIFPDMRPEEREHVVRVVCEICARHSIAATTRVNGWPKPR